MKTILNVKEAADLLRINKFTLYKFTREKRIAHIKMGRLVRFKYDDVIAFIEKQTVPVRDEVKYV